MSKLLPLSRINGYTAIGIYSKMIEYLRVFNFDFEYAVHKATTWFRATVARPQPNIILLLCYVLGWISGLFFLFTKREDSLVRFHAWQSIIVFGILTIPIIVLNVVATENDVLYLVLFILYWIVIAFTLFLWIFLILKAYRWQAYELPQIKKIVSKLSGTEKEYLIEDIKMVGLAFEARDNQDAVTTIAKAHELEEKVKQDEYSLRGVLNEAVRSIVILCETRDPYTSSHQQQVAKLACAIAREMGLSEDQIEGIRITGIIHDIGKVAVPAEILSKPGKINSHEFGIIKTHPQVAYDILKGLVFPWPVAQAILHHHERLDGSGYPKGLSGDDVIIEARILGVADVVEAMASHRPYRPALGIDKALAEISKSKGTLYDTRVVEACLKIFAEKRFTLVE